MEPGEAIDKLIECFYRIPQKEVEAVTTTIVQDLVDTEQADHRTTIEALKMSGTELKKAQQKIAALELQIKDLDHLLGDEFERTEKLKDILLNGIKEAVKVI